MWICLATLSSLMGSTTWSLAEKKPFFAGGLKRAPLARVVAMFGVLMWFWLPALCLNSSEINNDWVEVVILLIIAFGAMRAGDKLAWTITVRRLRRQRSNPLWWLHQRPT